MIQSKVKTIKYALLIIFLLIVPVVSADNHLPPGILKGQEYNKDLAQNILRNVSFFIAFLAGITSILSPCILPLLPAYFAITFKEKKRVTLATFIFFLGFTGSFVILGMLATLTGKSLISVFTDVGWVVPAAGLLIIFIGVLIFLGKGFSGFLINKKFKNDSAGVFVSGVAFAIGWTACIGPILSGVLIMSSVFNNYINTAYLMLAYSLGIFVPLFILSFFYNKSKIDKIRWLSKRVTINLGKIKFNTNYPNIISGLLFIGIGLVFVIFKGTGIINGLQMFGLRTYFYSFQNLFLENAKMFNTIGIVVFVIFIAVLIYFLIKEIRNKKFVSKRK